MCRPPTEVALLQRTVDRSELGIQLSAEAIHDGDNREGNASGDQSVFDRGRARFLLAASVGGPFISLDRFLGYKHLVFVDRILKLAVAFNY
jgi:hypothetical protein